METIFTKLEAIEARIDDLCGLLGELLERIDKGNELTEITIVPLTLFPDERREPSCIGFDPDCKVYQRFRNGT